MFDLSKKEKVYAIYGLLLGDGYIHPKYSNYMSCAHTNKQREYVKFIAKFCQRNNIEHKTRFDYKKNTNYGVFEYSEVRVKIPNREQFVTKFNRMFDDNGKKIVSDFVLKRISPIGLLFWFLDDGCLSVKKYENKCCRQATLATQGFSLEGNVKIQKMFKDRFDINVKIHKDRVYYKIYFSATEFRKFFDIVRPYLKHIPEDMKYKFNMQYEVNILNESSFLYNNYNLSTLQANGSGSARVPEMVCDIV